MIAPNSVRIVLTGYADTGAAIDAINKGGASRYITKPWNDDDICEIVRQAFRAYAAQEESLRR